jgi:PAS domain S-box-containing protein
MLHALRDQAGAIVDFEVVDCNERGARFYGESKAQLLGKKLSELYPEAPLRTLMTFLNYAMESGFFEHELEIPEGSPMQIGWARVKVFRAEAGLALTVEDVTERKRAETRQRLAASVFESALDGIMITDEMFRIVAVNPAFTDITGYTAADALGNSPRMLRSYDHDAAFYEEMQRTVNETGTWEGEIWDKRKDGTQYCELLAISAVRDEQGVITNYCAVFADITERKLAEAKLSSLNGELEDRVAARTRELERVNRELEAFSFSVSHDLRSPLRTILGFSEILIEDNEKTLDAVSLDHLKRIAAGATRMNELINDLLQLSKISRHVMGRESFDLSEMSASVVARLIEAAPLRKVHVVIAPGILAEGDPNLMTIVLENLLGNAWKFTSKLENASIEVGVAGSAGEQIYFVRDNGAGFDMKNSGRLFGAFQRLHASKEFEGTGVGLSIVQRIIARHEGRIWADAEVGRGATFFFTLWNARPPIK